MGDFQNVFKRLRLKSGLTQQEMANKLGLSRSTIGMYENGDREPNFEVLETIADFFNVDMNYLIGKKDTTEIIPDTYYLNEDARDMAQFMFENPEYKVLFDASKNVKKEDINFVKEMIDRFSQS
ncbi:MAG: helix-turn-helix domain-containing protein [Hespellia sp.]|nr:helix-turn-helix domain-containing protein [Hespellia sp.]